MRAARTNTDGLRKAGRLALAGLATITAAVALGTVVPGTGATGDDEYSIDVRALFSPATTELSVRVTGPTTPTILEKVQVKAWRAGSEGAETRNFFDVPSPGGVASISLTERARGDRVEVRVHLDERPQHNLDAETIVLRAPDLTVASIDVPDDVVRTREFVVSAAVAEVGAEVGAAAHVELLDGEIALASRDVVIGPGAEVTVLFPIALARPGDHMLRVTVTASAPPEWDVAPNERARPLYVNHYDANGVVATDHPLATQVGVQVLRSGGNAFDAAAAVQFAVSVTQPHLSGIGGSSNILVRDGATGEVLAIDARETAPGATTPTTYSGRTVPQVGPNGYAVGVPGTLRAIDYLLTRWGTRSFADALQPAIGLAENGFPVGFHLALASGDARSRAFPETNALFHRPDGTNLRQGDMLVQADLANTFRLLARDGISAFYEGEIAQAIVLAQRRATTAGREGRMTMADLAAYEIDVEQPLSLEYGGYDVLAPGPSTAGGAALLESLGLIREFRADPENAGYPWGFGTRNSLHVFIEAMRLAYADRDMWIGDERFSNVPAPLLLDEDYLRDRSELIDGETVMCSPVLPGNPFAYGDLSPDETSFEEGGHTTHFSIIDRWGNAVVMTSTLADPFGSGILVPGYGFLLNDSLTLFNLTPRANPATGNPGANDAAGGKRPMGSMTPTLVMKDGEPVVGTGTHAAAFIPSIVLNIVLNVLEFDMELQAAVEAPRIWMQTANGDAAVNPGLAEQIVPLRAMGHRPSNFGGCAGAMAPNPAGGTAIGSTGSFGVNLSAFELGGGQDSIRFPDATTVVVERN